jgi:Xaa-Pro aminopeptidase
MAKDQLRFDKAVVSAGENMEDWEKDLKAVRTTGLLAASTTKSLSEAYGDLLDIDGSALSAQFLKDSDNLELMKKALKGDQEAYAELQKKAAQEILVKCGIDKSQFDIDKAEIENTIATKDGGKLADLEVGANLDDTGFLQALTDMVNAAGMTQ